MTNEQEIDLSMMLAVESCLNANTTITAQIPGFSTYSIPFTNGLRRIEQIRQVQEADKKGVAINKKELRLNVINLTMDVSRKVCSFAVLSNNNDLLEEVNYKENELKKCTDTTLFDKCKLIHARATTYIASLTPYVTQAQLNTLQTAITAFRNATPLPRTEQSIKKEATGELEQVFSETHGYLHKMDILVEAAKTAAPAFVAIYKNNRKLVNTGKHFIALKCTAVEKENGAPVKDVLFMLAPTTEGGREFVKKTAVKGHFIINHMPGGTYQCAVSKAGYKTQTITIYITVGEMTEVNVIMERIGS